MVLTKVSLLQYNSFEMCLQGLALYLYRCLCLFPCPSHGRLPAPARLLYWSRVRRVLSHGRVRTWARLAPRHRPSASRPRCLLPSDPLVWHRCLSQQFGPAWPPRPLCRWAYRLKSWSGGRPPRPPPNRRRWRQQIRLCLIWSSGRAFDC